MARDSFDESKNKKKKTTTTKVTPTGKKTVTTKSQSSSVSKPKTTKATVKSGSSAVTNIAKAAPKKAAAVNKSTSKAVSSGTSAVTNYAKTAQKQERTATVPTAKQQREANRDANLNLKQTQAQKSRDRLSTLPSRVDNAARDLVDRSNKWEKQNLSARSTMVDTQRRAKDVKRRELGQAQKSGDYDKVSRLTGTAKEIADHRAAEFKGQEQKPLSTRAKLEEWDRDLSDTVWHTIKQGLAADARMANLGRKGITQKDAFLYTTEEQRKKADAKVKKLDTKLGNKIEKETQAIQDIQDRHGYIGKQALSAVSSATGMGMDIAAGAIIPGSSLFHMWTRSTGTALGEVNKKADNLRKQLKASGQYSGEELDEMFKNVNALDLANAGASGGIEVMSELLFPGMGAARKVIGGKGMSIAERVGAKLFNKVGARASSGLLKSMTRGTLEEVAEEEVGGPLQAIASNLIYGNKFQGYNEDAIKRSLNAESNALRSNIKSEADAQAAAARLSSKSFMDESIKSYMQSGYSKAEATRLAEMSRDYLTASLTGDVDTMKKYQDQMVNIMAGGENSQKQKFSLQDAIDAAVSTSMMTMVTGAPTALSTMQAGNAFKQNAGLDAVKQQAEIILNWETDPKEKAKAQAVIDHIDNGGDLSGTQVYEIVQKAGEVAEDRKQPEVIKNRTAQVEMNKRDLRISPINEDGSLAPQTQQRFEQIVSDTVSRHETLARLSNNQDRAEDFVGPEATFDRRNANTEEENRADVLVGANIGAAFEVGAINAEMVNELARGSETVKEVFREVTGIDVSQFSSYNEMNDSLMAEAANNLVNSARIEQVAWNDEARKQVSDYVRSDIQGSQGDLAIQDALESVDPRDRTQFLMTADVSSNLYDFARHTEGSWNEARQMVKQMYPSVDTNVLKQVFVAAKEDKQIAETEGYGKVVKSGEKLDRGSLAGEAAAYVPGKFTDQRVNKEGATLTEESLAKNIVSGFGINVILTDQAEVRDEKGNLLVNLGTELRDKDGNVVLDEEGNPVIQMDNGAFIPSSNTLVINAGADATRTVTQTAVHELTHHIAVHAPDEYVKLSRYIMDAWYRKDPEGFTRAIKARQAAYKAQKGQVLSDEQALEEIIADGAADFDWADEDFIADVTTNEPTLASKIIDAIKDVLQKIRNILASGSVIDERARDALYDKAVEFDTVQAMWLKAAQTARKAQADQAVDEWQDEANRYSIGYHAGDLGKSTVDDYAHQGYGRGTGHFGFGTYFVGDEEQINYGDYGKRKHETVDFDKYNLFRPRNFDQGLRLHDALKLVDGFATKYSEFNQYDRLSDEHMENVLENTSRINRAAERLVDDYEWDDYQWTENTLENKEKVDKYIAEKLDDYDRNEIESKARQKFEEEQNKSVDEDEIRSELARNYKTYKNMKDFWGNPYIDEDSEEEYINNNLEDTIRIRTENKAVPYEYYYYKEAQEAIKDETERWDWKDRKLGHLASDLQFALGFRHSEKEIADALRETERIVSGYKSDPNQSRLDAEPGLDSGATVFMKQLGYEGVDVRHIREMDNTGYGSVIYDLKDEDLARKQEIGTARFSITPQQDADYMKAVESGNMKAAQKMVDKAAEAAGYTFGKVYHGTPDNDFTVFHDGIIFFTSNRDTADEYRNPGTLWMTHYDKGRTLGAYIKLDNPLKLDNSYSDYRNEHTPWQEWNPTVYGRVPDNAMSATDVAKRAQEEGYDGVFIANDKDTKWTDSSQYLRKRGRGDTVIAFKSNQVKSADPVTYDDNGDVIPLSERFNQESPDIRWSVSPEQIEKAEADIGPMVRFSTPTYREIQPKAIYKSGVGFADYFKDASGRDLTYEWTKNNFSKEQADAVVAYLDKMAEWFEQSGEGSLRARYRFIGWDDLTDASVQVKTNDAGEIVGVTVSAMVKNGEYPVNFDLTTVCNKREGITNVIKNLIDKKVDGESVLHSIKLTDENMWKINQALKKENIDTACLGCFVEARRYYAQRFMDKIEDKWNKAVRQARKELGLPENEYFDFAKGRAVTGEEWSSIDSLWTAYDESTESKSSPADRIKILMDEIVKNKDVNSPYLKQIRISDILTPEGINGFKQLSNKGHDMVKTIKSIYGTSAPKEILAFTPYNSEIALLPTEMKGLPTGEYLKSIGGIRVQSFSDFKIAHVFEHFQMVADEAARNFYTHGYSKVIAFPRIFGLTGRKINMSVMFDVLNNKAWSQALGIPVRKAAKYAKKYQGLQFVRELPAENKDNRPYKEVEIEGVHGYLTYLVSDADYVNSIFDSEYRKNIEAGMSEDEARRKANENKPYEQSINYREAVELENQDGYKENVGIIAVAYGDEHLKMLLADPNVRYVIPYHKSGLPTFISKKTALAVARDYTNFQNTNIAESWKNKNGKNVDLKEEYEAFKKDSKSKYPAIDFFKQINDNNYKVKFGSKTAAEKAAMAGTADFDVYAPLETAKDIREVSNAYLEHCIEKGWCPIFHEFAGDPNYYKMLFDFAVTDGTFNNIYPQRTVRNRYPGLDIDAKVAAGEEITDEDLVELKKAVMQGAETENRKNMAMAQNMPNVMNDILTRGSENSIIDDTNLNSIRWDTPDYTDVKLGNEEMTPAEGPSDVRHSIAVNFDDAYMDAVNSNDMEEAQRFVDEAAGRAGYTTEAWHQTGGIFTVFNNDNPQAAINDSETPNGLFFKTNDHDIGLEGKRQMHVYLNPGRLLRFKNREEANQWYRKHIDNYEALDEAKNADVGIIDDRMEALEELMFGEDVTDEQYNALNAQWDEMLDELRTVENGYRGKLRELLNEYFLSDNRQYDGIYIGYDGHRYVDGKRENVETYIVFDSNQVKSADPVTYAEDGSVIPLSQRFDPNNNDIRYSLPTQDSDGKILTDGQMEYFKNSQARDEQGRLVPVYHTSRKAGFTIFDPSYAKDHRSIFFSDNYYVSQTYAEDAFVKAEEYYDGKYEPDAGYYTCYLNLENPMVIDARGNNWDNISNSYEGIVDRAWEMFTDDDGKQKLAYSDNGGEETIIVMSDPSGYKQAEEMLGWELLDKLEVRWFESDYGSITTKWDTNADAMGEASTTRDIAEYAYANGFDGVIIRNVVDVGKNHFNGKPHGVGKAGTDYIAFSSNQVKDVNNADPTENPDIRYSLPPENDTKDHAAQAAESITDIPLNDPTLEQNRQNAIAAAEAFEASISESWGRRNLNLEKREKTPLRNQLIGLMKQVRKGSDTERQYRSETLDATVKSIENMYGYAKANNAQAFAREAWNAAERIVDDIDYNDELYIKYEGMREYFAKTNMAIPEDMIYDADFADFVRDNYGRMRFFEEGEDIETVYKNLAKKYPELFPSEMEDPIDMVIQMDYVLSYIEPYKDAYTSEEHTKLVEDIANNLCDIVSEGKEYRSTVNELNVQAMKQRHDEAVRKIQLQRDRQKERAEKWKQRYEGRIQKDVADRKERSEKKEHKKHFTRIMKNYKTLCDWVLKPTKEKNVPEEFRKSLAELLQTLDLQTENSKALEEKTGHVASKTLKMRELKDHLKDLAESRTTDEGDYISGGFQIDAYAANLMDLLTKRYDGKSVDELDAVAIRDIDIVLSTIIKNIQRYKQVKTETKMIELSDIGRRCMEFFKAKLDRDGEYRKRKGLRGTIAEINATALTPTYLFDRLGPLKEMYDVLRHNGFDTYIRNEKMITDKLTEILGSYYKTNKKGQNMPGSIIEEWRDERSAQEIELSNGKTITMSVAQMMSLRCLVKRGEQATDHMMVGGIIVTPIQTTSKLSAEERSQKGRVDAAMTRAKRAAENFVEERTKGVDESTQKYVLSYEDIQNILARLTPEQAHIADQLQELMSVDMAKLGNEAHRELYGYDMFGEDNYFPIKVHGNERATDINNIGDVIEKIKSFGFTKPLTPKAGQAIEVDDIFSVVADHCNGMNLYNAYLVPITDFMKVFNYTHTFENGDSLTMKEAIEQAYGKEMKQYILNLMKDINGIKESNRGGLESIMNKALGRAKRTAVFGNIRVALQQPTAIVRALAEINPKYFKAILNTDSLKGFVPDNTTATMEELYKYCPIAQWKAWGYYDTYMGRDIEDVMMNTWSLSDKLLAGYYGQLDNASWAMIWMAVKAEQAAKHPGMDTSSEEFLQLCGRRASEVFDKTQVVDSTFHRSDAMRSKQIATKLFTAFMAEPTLTLNVFRAGLYNSNELRKEGKKGEANKVLGRAIGTIVLQAIVVSAAQAVADAWRGKDPGLPWGDDDDDEKQGYFWRWLHNFVYNLFDQAHLENNMYLVKDVTPYLNYMASQAADYFNVNPAIRAIMGWDQDYLYSQNNLVFAGLENTANGIAQAFKKLEKGDEYVDYNTKEPKRWYDINQKIASGIGTFTGFPVGTLLRDFKPIWDKLVPAVFAADTGLMDNIANKMGYQKAGSSDAVSEPTSDSADVESDVEQYRNSLSDNFSEEEKDELVKQYEKRIKKGVKSAEEQEKRDYDTMLFDAEKAAAGLEGQERNTKIWQSVSKGYKTYVEEGNYERIEMMRRVVEEAGGDVDYFDKQVTQASKSALKKSLKPMSEMTEEEYYAQKKILGHLKKEGVPDQEISEYIYKTETRKDLQVAMVINDEDAIFEELTTLVNAGFTEEDFEKAYKNRNRVRLSEYKENGGKYADRLKSTGTFIWPVTGPITSHFGYRNDVGSVGGSTNHPAIDIGIPIGTPVAAADGGVVIYAGSNSGYGNSVGIKHDNGMVTYYNHLDSWNVKVGDTVAQGQQIAASGNTGKSTGPHLDFKILDANGKPVNPEKYLGK